MIELVIVSALCGAVGGLIALLIVYLIERLFKR